jgi:hypothetical protein
MDEFQTTLGRITIGFAVPLIACVVWRIRLRTGSKGLRRLAVAAIVLFGILFLLSFMEWASWYK